ncbi:hypothetical protein IAQ61_004701 [Plenodomus lingam]|uniref:uncharacterized protein n=1 Tax=Leptosphaeria maculans TaxID=5022 RepID=UPI00332C163D|nr:hypothetical protein IAQ61_004701 [Plenodomus lingam]
MNSIFITGLATAYPPHTVKQDDFEGLLNRLYPDRITEPGTKIKARPIIFDPSTWTKEDAAPPSIQELSSIYQDVGVALSAQACSKAMLEAQVSASEITHIVAVTCTTQSNPGYDLFVCQKLSLDPSVQRVLLHGVGCAGGLSALRAAANLAAAASSRGQPARILVIACELCSLFLRAELQACLQDQELHIAPALFSDAAAAVVVTNGLALDRASGQRPVYELHQWGSMLVPGTADQMSYNMEEHGKLSSPYALHICFSGGSQTNIDTPLGMIANITKHVPKTAVSAILPMLAHLHKSNSPPTSHLTPSEFDWALHPGGASILQGATDNLGLSQDHIRASLAVYENYGNSSSPTVLIVLNGLRKLGPGRDHVVAASFGPGIAIEMFLMQRCREIGVKNGIEEMLRGSVGGKREKMVSVLRGWVGKVGEKGTGKKWAALIE